MKLKWILLTETIETIEKIKPIANKNIKVLRYTNNEQDLKRLISENEKTVLFLSETASKDIYELCGELSVTYPFVSIILLSKKENIDLKKAMYVGATDAIEEPIEETELFEAVHKAESILEFRSEKYEEKPKKSKQAEIITVCSTKGGVGKTTVSVNLAASFAKQKKKVAIIDLDLQFGDVSILFDAQPKKTIYEWMKESYETKEGSIADFTTNHESGVDIIAAPLLPEFAELIKGEHVSHLIDLLKTKYDVIMIDTPPALIETGLVALENSDQILLVVSMDLPTLKNGKLAIETLKLLGLTDRMKVILNRDAAMEGMTIEVVESILDMSVFSRIPSDYKCVVASLNRGKPFVLDEEKAEVSKSIISLSKFLMKKEEEEEEKKSLIKRLFKRA